MDPYSQAPARVRTLTSVQLPRPSVLVEILGDGPEPVEVGLVPISASRSAPRPLRNALLTSPSLRPRTQHISGSLTARFSSLAPELIYHTREYLPLRLR
jgi:hypothetical protein